MRKLKYILICLCIALNSFATTHVVIWMGQSNSVGRAPMDSLQAPYRTTLSNIKVWTGSSWASLDYTTNNNQFPVSARSTQFGSEFTLLTSLQAYYGGTIYAITYSVGGTALGTHQNASANWNIATRGSYYDAAISTINAALANLWVTQKITSDYAFHFDWEQGEKDSQDSTDANNYYTNITNLINAFRTNISGTAFTTSYKVWNTSRINTSIYTPYATSNQITAATNASPIKITTAAAHGQTTGDYVAITGVGGNTAANDTFKITVTSSTQFTLNGSTGNGTYTSGGRVSQNVFVPEVNAAQVNVCNIISNTYSMPTYMYQTQDGTHFSAWGYYNEGLAEYNIFISH